MCHRSRTGHKYSPDLFRKAHHLFEESSSGDKSGIARVFKYIEVKKLMGKFPGRKLCQADWPISQ